MISPNQELDTLDMQKKIIIKQKQLLELERKKLELELLQQQVKLQEQMKTNMVNNQGVAEDVPKVVTKPQVKMVTAMSKGWNLIF